MSWNLMSWLPKRNSYKRAPAKKPTSKPQIEQLERRVLLTTAQLEYTSYNVDEDAGSISAKVILDQAHGDTLQVYYGTIEGSADYIGDYDPGETLYVEFSSTETEKTISVTIEDDSETEINEDFAIFLDWASSETGNPTIGTNAEATVTIIDNDPPSVEFYSTSQTVSEDVGTMTVTVQLDAIYGKDITVPFTLSGTANHAPWGDYIIANSSVTVPSGNYSADIAVKVLKDFELEGDETIILTLGTPNNDATLGTNTVHTATISGNYAPPKSPNPPTNNPPIGTFGDISVDLNNGDISIDHDIDLGDDPDECDCECGSGGGHDGMASGGGDDAEDHSVALTYNSATAYSRPVLNAEFITDSQDPVPDQLEIRVDWNWGGFESWVSYDTTGHSAGDTYFLPVQLENEVTSTGEYTWQIEVRATYGMNTETFTMDGSSVILLHDDSPFGEGWSLSGVDQLITVGSDILYTADGGGRVFRDESGTFHSPMGDSGTLVQNMDYTYTYTNKHQVDYQFNSSGYMTAIEQPNSAGVTVTYSNDKIANIESVNGNFATFTYDGVSGNLDTIDVPSGTYTFTYDVNDRLTGIENPDNSLRTFTYNTNGQLTTDEKEAGLVSITWDATTDLIDGVDGDGATDFTVIPVNAQGLGASVAIDAEDAVAEIVNPYGATTTYDVNSAGQVETMIDPTGGTYTYDRNEDGDVTKFTDPLGNETDYEYGTNGNLTKITNADGTSSQYEYDPTYNKPTAAIDQFGNRVSYTYSQSTGELTQIEDDAGITTMTYANGRIESTEDPFSNLVTYLYDGSGRLQTIINPYGDRVTYGYDAAGNRTTVETMNGITTTTYDAMRRVVTEEDVNGNVTSYTYFASGQLESVENSDEKFTTYTYNALGLVATVENMYGDLTTYVYTAAGQVTEVIDPFSHVTYVYDKAGRQISVEDDSGITTTVYDAAGRVIATIDYLNHRTTTTYNSVGQVIGTEDPFENLTTTTYNSDGQIHTQTDIDGNTTTYHYDSQGRVEEVENMYAKLATTVYDSQGRVSVQIDEFGNRTTNVYDNEGRLESVEDSAGFVTYVYDIHGRQHATIDQLGNRTTTVFDSKGRVSETIDVYNKTTTTIYDTEGRVSVYIDQFTNRVTNVYDEYSRIESVEDSTGFVTYVYDIHGRQHATIDQLGNRTTTVFDAQGRVSDSVNALGTTTYFYDEYGRQEAVRDAEGGFATTVYDEYGRHSATIDANTNRTTTIYATDGKVEAIEDAAENLTTYHYDLKGRLEAIEDARGNFVTTVFDAHGRAHVQIDQLGNRTTTIFDNEGRVSDVVNPLGTTTYFYDEFDRVEAVEDAEGDITTTVYDGFGRVSETIYANSERTTNVYDAFGRQHATIDQLGGRTTIVFDNVTGLQQAVIDPINNRTTFSYDALGREIEREDAGGSATFAYNAIGLMSSTTDQLGRRRDFVYDANGQLLTETWIPNGGGAADNIITHSYDANGNLLAIEDENGAYTMTYDVLNRVETFEDMWGSLLTYSYDAVGNRTLVEDSEGGVQTSTYDAASNLTRKEFGGSGLTPLRIDFTYNGNSQVDTITRYSDLAGTTVVATTDYTYDDVGRVTNLHHEDSNPTNIANYTYVYDAVGNLVTEELNSSLTTYQYDDANQLTDDGVNTHEYDANGNRIDGGYDVGPINQYTTDGTWDYVYDAAGNMTEKEDTVADIKWEYGYDHMNRLVWVEKIDTDTTDVLMRADYKYDALGNRIEKAVDADGDGGGGTDTTRYSYDGFKTNGLSYVGNENWDVWADLDGDNLNDIEMRYIRGNGIDELFARHDDVGTVAWYLTDKLGSVRHITNNSGTVQNTIAYDGFGNITSESNVSFGDRYKFTSREYDVETNLQYNRQRYYDSELGRWISKDPLGFGAGDSNLYRYVHNQPTVATDPSGLEDFDDSLLPAPGFKQAWIFDAKGNDIGVVQAIPDFVTNGERGVKISFQKSKDAQGEFRIFQIYRTEVMAHSLTRRNGKWETAETAIPGLSWRTGVGTTVRTSTSSNPDYQLDYVPHRLYYYSDNPTPGAAGKLPGGGVWIWDSPTANVGLLLAAREIATHHDPLIRQTIKDGPLSLTTYFDTYVERVRKKGPFAKEERDVIARVSWTSSSWRQKDRLFPFCTPVLGTVKQISNTSFSVSYAGTNLGPDFKQKYELLNDTMIREHIDQMNRPPIDFFR